MASQVFNFPGFFDREIDLSQQEQAPVGIPGGVCGASERGPAFVPITVGSFEDFKSKFGDLNPRFVAPYAAEKHLANRTALTFVRVLGAGANTTAAQIENTRTQGIVNNAGFMVTGSLIPDPAGDTGATHGMVQFLCGRHVVSGSETYAQAGFTNNDSLFSGGASDEVMLVRGVIMMASGARIQLLDNDEYWAVNLDDAATADSTNREFKIVISSSTGVNFANDEAKPGIKILTASLNPTSDNYFAKILNTDPEQFATEKCYVYADYAVDYEVAPIGTGSGDIVIASGSAGTSTLSGDTSEPWLNAFGRFDTRYQTPKTTKFISQPFGKTEYDLFYIEALDDGEYANKKFKVSISNLKKSANPKDSYGSFALVVRAFDDTDTAPQILEQFNNMSLNPEAENYIGRVIGDKRAYYYFDAEDEDDRRLIVTGKFGNKSKYIRVVMEDQVERKLVPAESLPFGFRGIEVPSYNSRLLDRSGSGFSDIERLQANLGSSGANTEILASLVPPPPLRFKVTRGAVDTASGRLEGAPGSLEIVDPRYYWGIKGTRNKVLLNPNPVTEINSLVKSLTQFNGLSLLDVMVTSSFRDVIHNDKFTLARVTLGNGALADVTSSAETHMKETCYLRNGVPDVTNYTIDDSDGTARITFASLLNKGSSASVFNNFTNYAKFTTILQGGFDGVNILDKNAATLNDRASSTEGRTTGVVAYGNVHASFTSPGFNYNQNGTGITNNTIASYRTSAKIITDSIASNVNIVAVPGQREPLVTDYFADEVNDFGLAMYVMDIPNYNAAGDRIFDGEVSASLYLDPNQVKTTFEARALDKDASAAYFPDVVMDDETNNQRVTVAPSVAAVSALSFNDRVSFPWFAPAGFNRGSLDFVQLTKTRINQTERENLYAAHINPIVKYPRQGYVIMAQNTLEQAETALGSVNVQRMLISLKRTIINIGNRLLWEQITPDLYAQLRNQINPVLTTTQIRQGIESFKVICDSTNNTDADVNDNRINCKIILVPTRAVEFIAIDFVITRSGVAFS
jgi:hypothetical protein